MTGRRPAVAVVMALAATVLRRPGPRRAPAEGDSCAASYERAQEDRSAGHLVDARAELLVCAQTSCPEFIMTDCRRWLDEVEYAMPTVVFAVREGTRDLEDVLVTRNGKLIANRLDGRAVAVDPGKQRFVFELKRQPAAHGRCADRRGGEEPGDRRRGAPPDRRGGADRVRRAPGRRRRWPRAGPAAVAGAAGAGRRGGGGPGRLRRVSRWRAGGRNRSLADRCAPRCTDGEVQSVRRKYLLADISLGVGVGALAVAGYLYLRDPYREPTPALTLAIQPLSGGTVLTGFSRPF